MWTRWQGRCAAGALAMGLAVAGCGDGQNGDCEPGAGRCAADGRTLTVCQDGQWQTLDCLAEQGRLCEAGACVDPWRYGDPQWSRCEDDPLATPESLHAKMLYYEDIARRLHLHPELKWIADVRLACAGDDCSRPVRPEEQATLQDVERFRSGENDGLWSALYLAAEAFRYGATGEAEALDTIRLLLAGEVDRMAVTGVPGVFTRQYVPPAGVAGVACPAELERYVPDLEKDDNQWVRVGDDGCVQVVDGASLEWVTTEHCGLDAYAGWCWLDNVSQDEYAGHMFALGAIVKLVDDEQILATARELLQQIGDHLVDTRLEIHDWDGRPVEHGRLYAMALDNFPGFNAAMAMDFMLICAEATGDPRLRAFYDDCLLQKSGTEDCLQRPVEQPRPYTEHLDSPGLYVGADDCLSNWNNISMHFASLHNLIWFERDPAVRQLLQQHLESEAFAPPGAAKPVAEQHNAWFDFIYAAHKPLGPDSDGPALQAVADGVCMLRQFPASQATPELQCPPEYCQQACLGRLDNPLSDTPRPVAERCPRTFLWWASPYKLGGCSADPRSIRVPSDYLLAYWMGRYYGFISEDM